MGEPVLGGTLSQIAYTHSSGFQDPWPVKAALMEGFRSLYYAVRCFCHVDLDCFWSQIEMGFISWNWSLSVCFFVCLFFLQKEKTEEKENSC